MIQIDQTTVDGNDGDCMRAVAASLLDLKVEQVPNFILFEQDRWWSVFYYFMYSMGWEYTGFNSNKRRFFLKKEDSIDGLFYASVPSATFPGKTHAVIIDLKGVVVHDPNPNKKWLGKKVFIKRFDGWYMFKPVEKVGAA